MDTGDSGVKAWGIGRGWDEAGKGVKVRHL